jgi:hypothetical protein
LVGEWYKETFSTTVATVVTQFTQYNDSIVTGSTIYNGSSSLPTVDAFRAYSAFTYIPDSDVQSIFGAPLAYGAFVPVLGTETYVSGAGLM